MDMYKLKWTRLQGEIIRFLGANVGKQTNQRQIAEVLGVSPTAVSKALKDLVEEDFVKLEKQGSMNLILVELNRENLKALQYKRAENLRTIYEPGLVEFLEEKFPGTTIILFGSYSRGDDVFDSDIDVAVIGAGEKEVDLKKFEKILKKEIVVNFYKDWKEIKKDLRNNILNGIVLVGGVDL